MTPASNAALHAAAEHLALVVGEEFVSSAVEGVIHVLPSNTQQVSTILEYATKNGLTVDPRGGGTKQHWGKGTVPHIRLYLSRLDKVLDHPWQDLTCTVQAGCRWFLLQQNLAKHGQFVALDPLFGERATVGGILATNDSGALRHRYGSLRDLVIGMTLVLSDGTIARTGGKVVKNVAGYDLCKLLTGSMGTLAIITEANFRLHPLPQYSRTFTVAASHSARLASLLAAIRGSHLLVQSLQLRRNKTEARLDICLSSHAAAHQDILLEGMVRGEGLAVKEANEASCFEREALFVDGSTFIRASTLPTNTCVFTDELQHIAPKIDVVSVSQGIGLHDISLRGSPDEITTAISRIRANQDVAAAVLQSGPDVDARSFTIPTPVMSAMQAIKRNFDPKGVLGPGKFFVNA
jgi:glycolate oxidase FAD binding subunit